MQVLGVVWVGTRTEAFDQTVSFFRDVLGVPMDVIAPDFGWSRMPDSSQLEVFGPADLEHRHFATGPVPEFLVEDLPAALGELRAAGGRSWASHTSRARTGGCTSAPLTAMSMG